MTNSQYGMPIEMLSIAHARILNTLKRNGIWQVLTLVDTINHNFDVIESMCGTLTSVDQIENFISVCHMAIDDSKWLSDHKRLDICYALADLKFDAMSQFAKFTICIVKNRLGTQSIIINGRTYPTSNLESAKTLLNSCEATNYKLVHGEMHERGYTL